MCGQQQNKYQRAANPSRHLSSHPIPTLKEKVEEILDKNVSSLIQTILLRREFLRRAVTFWQRKRRPAPLWHLSWRCHPRKVGPKKPTLPQLVAKFDPTRCPPSLQTRRRAWLGI
jgi:hypothetical protein